MNCRDVREMADSFLSQELLTETNHDMLRHLASCPACRADIEGRRRLRGALRDAFARAPELQAPAEFQHRLRARLQHASDRGTRAGWLSRGWLALAAGAVLAAGVSLLLGRPATPTQILARDAVGDHRNCALKYRLVRMPVPLDEAARQFDPAYRLLAGAPPDRLATPGGVARVTERHSCAYGSRRFGHVIMEYRGRVVSLLMTANGGPVGSVDPAAIPHVLGRPLDGLSVVSVDGPRHAFLLVSDLDSGELMQLSQAVSVPLAQRLDVSVAPDTGRLASLQPDARFRLPR